MEAALSLEINELNALKGKALKRRLQDLKKAGRKDVTETLIARALKLKSRVTVAQWKAGKNWASNALVESKLEDFLGLPPTFFAQIGKGVSYADALTLPLIERRKEVPTLTIAQRTALMKQLVIVDQGWRRLADMFADMGMFATEGMVGESKKTG